MVTKSSHLRHKGAPAQLRRPTVGCVGRAWRDRCRDCGHVHERWEGCGRANCVQPGCQEKHRTTRGKRLAARLGALGAVPWGIVTITTPPAIRTALLGKAQLRRFVDQLVPIVVGWLRRECWFGQPVALGGVAVTHPEGDKHPGSWAPHVSFLVPMRGVDIFDGQGKRGRFYVDPPALNRLRLLVRHFFLAEYRYRCRNVNVHWEFRTTPEKVQHAARYFGRGFPSWEPWTHRPLYFGLLLRPKWKFQDAAPWLWIVPRPGRCLKCGGFVSTIAHSFDGGKNWVAHKKRDEHGPPE